MVQRGNGMRLAFESLGELLSGNLHGDRTVEPRVARLVHLSHSASTQGRKDLVGAKASPG
jgi:hypothetical protein